MSSYLNMWSGDKIPINDIFFVYLLDVEGTTERVIIFCHDTVKNTDALFSETQLEYFLSEDVKIVISKQMIYKEDSVSTIVQKIRQESNLHDDMYLFTEDRRDVSTKQVTTYRSGLQYSLAYGIDLGDHPVGKPFSATEWSSLLKDQVKTVFVPVGYKHISLANPFSVLEEEDAAAAAVQLDEPFLHFSTTSTNIYVCFKEKVSEYARNQGLNKLVSIYFPARHHKRAVSRENDLIDEIHRYAWYESSKVKRGIHLLENVTVTWKLDQSVPLDAIFKRFHTSADVPCVTWFPKGTEPLVRLFKPTAEAWAKPKTLSAGQKKGLHFHLHRAILSFDSSFRMTLVVPHATSVSDLRFPEKIIQQINQILHSISFPQISIDLSLGWESMKPWQESCHFHYLLTLPSSSRFVEPFPMVPLFEMFHKTMTSSRVLTLHNVPLLDYVPIVDKYFNYVLNHYTEEDSSSKKSFWAPPPMETDDMVAVVPATTPMPFFQRPLPDVQGFQVLERPTTSLEERGSVQSLLGEPGWTPRASGNFLQVMAMYYAHERNMDSPPSSEEFRKTLIEAMTLDRFLKYHNGNLPALFRSTDAAIDTEPYQDSLFAQRLNLSDPHQLDLFQGAVASYETFIKHLRSGPTVEYAHVWDLITDVNPMPFGLNLILIRQSHGKSQFVCPANAYSSMTQFDPAKKTAIVLQEDTETFVPLTRDPHQWTVQRVPKRIQALAEQCKPTPSLSADKYAFRSSLTASELHGMVKELDGKFIVIQQVVALPAKVVALQIKGLDAKQQTLYVPCLPSAFLDDIPQITREQSKATLLSYEVTRDRLMGLAYASQSQIPCKPLYKVVKQGMRLGLVTEANEFVPTMSSDDDDDDGLEEVGQTTDETAEFMQEAEEDSVAVALRLEGQFYRLYHHVVQGLLEDARKQTWQQQLHSVSITYQNKVQYLEKEIESLVSDHVHFQILDPAVYKDIHDMITCSDENKDAKYCLASSGQTVFPKFNLVDPTINNETMYAIRLADELVRVRRTQQSFLHDGYLNAPAMEYNLADDEVLVPWSNLQGRLLLPGPTVWDTATPDLSTTSPMEMMDAVEFVQECILDQERRITGFWRKCFARPMTETIFQASCTFAPLLYIAQQHRKTPLTLASARQVLWKAYASYFDPETPEKYKEHAVLLQLLQVKDADEIRQRILDKTDYNLNDVDWWVFCQSLHIPAFLIWKKGNPSAPWLRLYTEPAETTSYFFIQKHHRKQYGRYAIVNRQFTMAELNTTSLRDDQDRLVIQEI